MRRCYHLFVRETLQVLLQLRSEGRLGRFAVGGAVAASFYIEAVATEDLDIFALLAPSASGLLVLTPLYDRLKDFLRVHSLIEAGCVDAAALARMVEQHGLSGRWSIYARRYA